MTYRLPVSPGLAVLLVMGTGCARIDEDRSTTDGGTDLSTDLAWDTDTGGADSQDTLVEVSWDSWGDATDGVTDSLEETAPDTAVDTVLDTGLDTVSDTAVDPPTETGPCSGSSLGGFCWYLGGEEVSCATVCGSHGGYSDGTRTFAGSSGTLTSCNDVLNALGAAGTSTGSLSASGSGVGCFLMNLVNDRYWVSDTPTTADATYMLGRRACACNE